MNVYIVQTDQPDDSGIDVGPVFLNQADARRYIEKYSPTFTTVAGTFPRWYFYAIAVHESYPEFAA